MIYDLAPYLDQLGVEYDPDRMTNQKVHCPFHEDSVPSASVNLEEGLFNCFGGCDIRGDLIALIQLKEGCTFGEAKRLAESISGPAGDEVPRGAYAGGDYLPRRAGSRPGRRAWKSPWSRKRP